MQKLSGLCSELFPLCRSITGDGVRQTLAMIGTHVPLVVREVPSGTPIFDWTVPNEWNIRAAWINDARGNRVVDFARNNLHVVSYSTPVRQTLSLAELRPHLHSLPDRPDWIPYRTAYYKESWGFCLTHRQLESLEDGDYEVCIDSTLAPGHMTLGEVFLQGSTDEEVLVSTHVCHPSLANDNLSGIAVATRLVQHLQTLDRRYSYRFLFIPGTIGAIAWLALNEAATRRVRHGLVISGVGDRGHVTYKRSRRGHAEIDRAVEHVLKASGDAHDVVPFSPYGYDERQFCSPGFDLPVGCFMRTPFGKYPQYHTSADNLDLIDEAALNDSLDKCLKVFGVLEGNRRYVNLNPMCEPQLGRRGLYSNVGGQNESQDFQMAMLWVLNLSDGAHSLLDVAETSGIEFGVIKAAADALERADLLRVASPDMESMT